MRLALAALIGVLGLTVVVLLTASGNGRERSAVGRPADGAPGGYDLLVKTPPGVLAVCRSAGSPGPMPVRCPPAIPVPDGAWGRARALDDRACQYLVDVEPGGAPAVGPKGPIYHLLFGARCRSFDLRTDDRRWPTYGFIANDLRLVGRRPLRPGELGRADGFAPAQPRVVARVRVGARPGLVLRHREQPLTTVHSGHLAIVWNQANAGYVVSGHPTDPRTEDQERRTIQALRAMALAMQSVP
jgi:hypothetical protein